MLTNLADFYLLFFLNVFSGLSSQLPAEDRVHVVMRGDSIGAGYAEAQSQAGGGGLPL